ncbi:MAG: hypothetical protein KAH07_10465 [Flavobacteriaceae bacterium]|nr:hypothetical protein [Flavobacteriaceae bacterium]
MERIKEINTKEIENSITKLLEKIDLDYEVIPFNNFEKLIKLLEFLKGASLNVEEKLVVNKMIIAEQPIIY